MRAASVSLNLPMRLAWMLNCEPPVRPASTPSVLSAVSPASENQSAACELEIHVAARPGVIVDGHRDRHVIALRKGDRQIEVDEEVLEDLDAGGAAAQSAPSAWMPSSPCARW